MATDVEDALERPHAPRWKSRMGGRHWWISIGISAFATALCAWLGYYTMFNSFSIGDDDGYMLIALKTFAQHGGLYTHVFSQYGPFPFEALSTVFSWLPVTPDSGRIATLVMALLTSLGFGVAIKMLTRNVLAGFATQVGSFVLLLSFSVESLHPAILVCLLSAVALVALALVARGQRSIGCTMLGATVAALALTELNAGAFAAIAILFTGFSLAPPIRTMRLPRVGAAVLFVATPILLIVVAGGHTSGETWTVKYDAIKYALVVALAATGIVVMTLDRSLQGLVHRRDAYRFLLGGGVLGTLVLLIAFLSGTRPVDLVRGILIAPTNQANVLTIALHLSGWVLLWGAACLGVAVWYRQYRLGNSSEGMVDSCARVIVGLLILYCALAQTRIGSVTLTPRTATVSFTVALPLLFFVVIPRAGATESERIARVAIAALAVLESLLAYPVAGAQVWWASLLIVPAGVLCLMDGVRQLRPALSPRYSLGNAGGNPDPQQVPLTHRGFVAGLIASAALLAGIGWFSWDFFGDLFVESSSYSANTAVTLPGSGLIRLPATQARTLESLSQAIRAQCSTLVTFPGLNSFYFWAKETPPSGFNTTDWLYLLDRAQQDQFVHRIEVKDQSRRCVVESPVMVYGWVLASGGHPPPQLPLLRLIERFDHENNPPRVFGGYQLFVSHAAK